MEAREIAHLLNEDGGRITSATLMDMLTDYFDDPTPGDCMNTCVNKL